MESDQGRDPSISRVQFRQIPIGGWVSWDINGRPGQAVTQKRMFDLTVVNEQYVSWNPEDLCWWHKFYDPAKEGAEIENTARG